MVEIIAINGNSKEVLARTLALSDLMDPAMELVMAQHEVKKNLSSFGFNEADADKIIEQILTMLNESVKAGEFIDGPAFKRFVETGEYGK